MLIYDTLFGPGYGASKLTIDTASFLDSVEDTINYCKSFENSFDEYIELLNIVSHQGFIEGRAAERLRHYTELISKLDNVICYFARRYDNLAKDFLREIDEADGFLYPRGFKGRRIYTDDMFRKLLRTIDNDLDLTYLQNYKPLTRTVKPYVFEHSLKMRWMERNINSLQMKNKMKILQLKNRLRKIDAKYSQNIGRIVEEFECFTKFLRMMVEIVEPETGKLNFTKMFELEELIDLLEQPDIEIDGSVIYERIKYLLAQINIGEHYFGSPIWNIREYIRKYLAIVSIERIIYLRRYWIWLLSQSISGDYEIPSATINVWHNEATGILNNISIGETEDWWGDEATPITIQHYIDVVGRIPALGSSIQEFLAMLEDLYIQVRTAEKIKQDIINECEKEETPSEFVDAFKLNYDSTIIDMINRYVPPKHTNNPFANGGLIKKLLKQAMSGEWAREGATSDEMLCAWSEECDGHLNDAVAEAQNTPEDAAGYNGALDNVASWIEESRQAKMDLFERMANKSSGEKKDYYSYCYNQLDSSTIFNCDFVEMMSFDQFLSA